MSEPRCLVVEDEDLLAALLAENLSRTGLAVERAADGDAAVAALAARAFDLLVLDVMLPGRDGFSVLQWLRARDDRTPVLVLSACATDADRIRGLQLAADDYLVKPFNLDELLLRCRNLLRRTRRPVARTIEFGGNRVDLRARRAVTWRGEEVTLTPAELQLLTVLDDRAGEVVDRQVLVRAVFGPHTPVKHRTLDNLVLHLRRLFERDAKEPRHFHTVRAVGLRFERDG
ncbi:MAG TPA: response regulator transcription factor [Planctomycetota bacterium]|nr:response regulator transcription factor [Planctomycetota bacterium]